MAHIPTRFLPDIIKTPLKRWRFRHTWSEHELAAKRFYAGFIPAGSSVFDVGANVGSRTKVFAALADMVVAVEPQETCLDELRRRFRNNPKVRLVSHALGAAPGNAEMFLSSDSGVSTLSTDWIETAQRTGRFGDAQWRGRQTVQMTTLDELIGKFGVPSFIKIDVEGFEIEVLRGLTQPVPAISFEFVPEREEVVVQILSLLARLGNYEGNVSIGESFQFLSDHWVDQEQLISILQRYRNDMSVFGDVYVRFRS